MQGRKEEGYKTDKTRDWLRPFESPRALGRTLAGAFDTPLFHKEGSCDVLAQPRHV